MKFKKLKVKYFDTIFYIIATIAIGYFLFITVDKKEIGLSRIELLEGNFESIYENKATKRSGASYDIDIQDNEDILKILPNYFKCFKFQEFILEVKPNDKITLLIDVDENFIFNSVKSIISIKVGEKEYLSKACISTSIQKAKTRIPLIIAGGLILLLIIIFAEKKLIK